MSDWETARAENLVRHKSGGSYLRAKVAGKVIRKTFSANSLRGSCGYRGGVALDHEHCRLATVLTTGEKK